MPRRTTAVVPKLTASKEAMDVLDGIKRNAVASEKLAMFFRLLAEDKQAMLVNTSPDRTLVLQGEAQLAIQLMDIFES